jgi:branched-chain amino acid transport system permease protein
MTSVILISLLNGLVIGFIYTLVALGLTLIFSIMRIVNFTHGAILMFGAYVVYYLFQISHQNYFLSCIAAFLGCGIIGLGINRFFLKRLRGQELPIIMATIGLTFAMEQGAMVLFGFTDKRISSVFSGLLKLFGIMYPLERIAIATIGIVLVLGLMTLVYRSKTGLAMRALVDDNEAAALHGINRERFFMLAMFLSCGLAGLAGGLVGTLFVVSPQMGGFYLVKGFIIIIVGGLGNIPGAVAGGLILGIVDSVGELLLGTLAQALGFAIVVLILIFRPGGLFGER